MRPQELVQDQQLEGAVGVVDGNQSWAVGAVCIPGLTCKSQARNGGDVAGGRVVHAELNPIGTAVIILPKEDEAVA